MSGEPLILSERFEAALVLAISLHRNQHRKGTSIPYASHLLSVAALALESGADEDEAIAALLHDSVEDCGPEVLADLQEKFGQRVADIVSGCTDSVAQPRPPWRERKEDYLEHLRRAQPSVQLVASADKLHNARCILSDYRALGEELWSRFSGGRDGVLWYYRALADVIADSRAPRPLAEELRRTVEELRVLAGVE